MRLIPFLCAFVTAAVGTLAIAQTQPATPEAAEVNLLSMGDWGTNGPGQRTIALTMAKYVQQSGKTFDGMILVGDNFYMNLPGGVNDPVWQSAFETMYDPARLNFPFFAVLGNHDYQNGKDAVELQYAQVHPESRWKLPARWYRLDIPKDKPLVTVLMLDSDKDPLGVERWEQEKAWMESELSKPRGTWTICCTTIPCSVTAVMATIPFFKNNGARCWSNTRSISTSAVTTMTSNTCKSPTGSPASCLSVAVGRTQSSCATTTADPCRD